MGCVAIQLLKSVRLKSFAQRLRLDRLVALHFDHHLAVEGQQVVVDGDLIATPSPQEGAFERLIVPLLVLILAVLGSIVMGPATPTEVAAVGAFGGFLLAVAYRQFNMTVLKESVFLTAKTSAMVCWLFVGSAIFSAAFVLLGGQKLVERWVMSMNLSKTEFLVLSQVTTFILGWPLEWTEIIVIIMPTFIPLLDNFGVDPLFFGLLQRSPKPSTHQSQNPGGDHARPRLASRPATQADALWANASGHNRRP